MTNGADEEKPVNSTSLHATLRSTTPDTMAANGDAIVDETTASFDELALKKKKKSKKPKEETAEDAEAPAADEEFDPTALKKKKKKKAPKAEDDFEAQLAEAGVEDESKAAEGEEPDGDMSKGTGVWAHDSDAPINYNQLLARFFTLLNEHNPDLMSSGSKSYKIPPPQCLREGNKKTIFANIAEICKRMKRTDEHVTQFLFAELGTTGSTDGSRRLVIKGKFLQKQIENVLRRYISTFTVDAFSCKPILTSLGSGICHLQDLPLSRHGAGAWREPSLLCLV